MKGTDSMSFDPPSGTEFADTFVSITAPVVDPYLKFAGDLYPQNPDVMVAGALVLLVILLFLWKRYRWGVIFAVLSVFIPMSFGLALPTLTAVGIAFLVGFVLFG